MVLLKGTTDPLIEAARNYVMQTLFFIILFLAEAVNTWLLLSGIGVLVTQTSTTKTPYILGNLMRNLRKVIAGYFTLVKPMRKDKGPTQEYILLPLQPHRTRTPVEDVAPAAHEISSESSPKDNDVQDSEDVADKVGQHQMTEDEQVLHDELEKMIDQEVVAEALDDATRPAFEEEKRNIASQKRTAQATSTNKLSTEKIPIDASTLPNADLPIDPNMPDLENDSDAFSSDGIFNGAYDDENVGAVADFNNMDDTINASPIPTLRIHKNHPNDQILGDPKSAI
ncbi:hypothetical protein Tco_0356510 [Tanacetum coccineum]